VRVIALLLTLALGAFLLGLSYSPSYGGSYAYYVANWGEIGAPNLVSAILAGWRAYDSLGEASLLFTAVIGFYLLLGGKKK
jgi:multisubunit Na+/H+ antiporter MnhB subunit